MSCAWDSLLALVPFAVGIWAITWLVLNLYPVSLLSDPVNSVQRDEDLDTSYEGLLHLTGLLGEARSRGTPASVMSSLPSGIYKDWAKPGESEERCPICLDDYQATDPVLKVTECSHWFHKGCLEVRRL
ncbi:hypothetical protein B0H21DRAFT_696156 [Amylocystis lapponica]|nr:hypothetical protein B0H21DRAFT_696156 [Amylocystis lapponica]